MPYPELVHYNSPEEYEKHFVAKYIHGQVVTFDGIVVKFKRDDFSHCFYESSKRNRIKDKFSPLRAQRIDWIQAALTDPASERYIGWDKSRKRYDNTRRVTVVMGNYVVVIALMRDGVARFITAYVADTPGRKGRPSTIEQIRSAPKWT